MDPLLIKPILDLVKPAGTEVARAAAGRKGQTKDAVVTALHEKFAEVIRDADPVALAERMIARREYMTLKKQLNYENVMELALEMAADTPHDKLRALEEDWFSRWFEAVESVSDDVVQRLWAKAFAHQATAGSARVSLRALDSLRLMERSDVIGFSRAVDVFAYFGIVFGASQEVIDGIMRRDTLNALIDLGLVSREESLIRTVAIPGGYLVRFHSDGAQRVIDPIHVFKLSPRGVELAPTLPSDLVSLEASEDPSLDTSDPLCRARYINMIARGLDDLFDITLCVYPESEGRPPKGRRKRTHVWDKMAGLWVRKEELPFDFDERIVGILESPSPLV